MPDLKQEADSYLAALMHYTEGFYASAIKRGMKAGPVADSVAHVEKAARNLHQLATSGASAAVAATVADLLKQNELLKKREANLREALFRAAPSHQGGHSDTGAAIADALGVPFPIKFPEIENAAKAEGFDPAALWPWLMKIRGDITARLNQDH